MPDTDAYTFVAVRDIFVGGACAYREGDPVPAENVKAHGYEDDGLVVHRSEYKPREDANQQGEAMERGEVPERLQRSAVPPAEPPATDEPKNESAEKPATATKRSSRTTSADKS